ncbi:hypothetical protein MIC448_260023 [Microbacterium sp. C448]|uniref:Ltp family lipoprotein n=1 Tax=Microbacterium TaxID=33882 RepID=UPI0003DE0332|nr:MULTISPECIES: Ltp family lipoprotein [Microbacterium]CDK00525.1 hypothetical protein MIC448_260023 [Microbacterium sp. C448]
MTNPDDGRPTYAAGWYADVNAPGSERWYDGTAWTEHVRPVQTPLPPEVAAATAATAAYPAPVAEAVTTAYVAPPSPSVTPATAGPVTKRPWYKRKGIIIPVAIVGGLIVVSGIGSALGGGRDDIVADQPLAAQTPEAETEVVVEAVMVDVPNVVGMSGSDAQAALSALGFQIDVGGGDVTMPVTAQDIAAGAQAEEGSTVRLTLQEKPKLTLGQENALDGAEQYLDFMPFSRAGLIEQLTSEYGSGFAPEDAEFAVATLEQAGKVDWNAEAAEAAQSYLDAMSFSRDGLYDQLTSSYGAGFTPDQANAGLAAVGY